MFDTRFAALGRWPESNLRDIHGSEIGTISGPVVSFACLAVRILLLHSLLSPSAWSAYLVAQVGVSGIMGLLFVKVLCLVNLVVCESLCIFFIVF